MNIKDKNVLITGAARRIGAFLALSLAKDGANVIIHYNSSEDKAKSLKKQIESLGRKAFLIKADLEDEKQVESLARQALEKVGVVHILINNASIYYPVDFLNEDYSQLDRFYKIHIKAPYILSQILGKKMLEEKEGRIINIVDYSPLRPYKGFAPYIITKGGLLILTKVLAKELAPHVLVNAVLPGPIVPTEGIEDLKKPLEKTVLKKWGGEKEVYKAVKYLIETEFTTGAFIPVEGGRLIC